MRRWQSIVMAAAVAGLSALAAAPAAAQVELVDLEGNRQTGELEKIDAAAGKVHFRGADGGAKVVELGDLVELVNRGHGAPVPPKFEIQLRSGELIRGRLGDKPAGGRLTMQSALGRWSLDLNDDEGVPPLWIRTVGTGITRPLETGSLDREHDALFALDGTLITKGFVEGFTATGVQFVLNDAEETSHDRPFKELGAVWFGFEKQAPVATDGLRAIVEGIDGSVLTGKIQGLEAGALSLASDGAGAMKVPLAGIQKISLSGGRFVYLSDVTPSKIVEMPHLFDPKQTHAPPFAAGTVRNYHPDRAYPGTAPLRLGGRTHRKGLGLHSWVAVTYELKGAYTHFTAQVGIDDSVLDLPGDVEERGSVVFRVLVDGKERGHWPPTGFLTGGAAPLNVSVPLDGAVSLTLVVDYAGPVGPPDYADTHIRDRVAVVAPRLVK
jgi:hypothetical protein